MSDELDRFQKDEIARLTLELAEAETALSVLKQEYDHVNATNEVMAKELEGARGAYDTLISLMAPVQAGEPAQVGDELRVEFAGAPMLQRVVDGMVTALNQGPGNFRAVSFESQRDGQKYSLTIQREGGKTPTELVGELERELAEAKKLDFKVYCLEGQLDEVEEQRDKLRDELADLRRKAGEWANRIEVYEEDGLGCQGIANEMRREAGNFRAVSFESQRDGQKYSLTIQREGGITPAQRITELEAQAVELRRKIGEWAEMMQVGRRHIVQEEMREEAGK